MANKGSDKKLFERWSGYVTGFVALVTSIVGLIKLSKEDMNLMTVVLLVVALISSLAVCIHVAFKRKVPKVFVNDVKWVWKYPRLRPVAIVLIVILPILVLGGLIYKFNTTNSSFVLSVPANNELQTNKNVEAGDVLEFVASGTWYWGTGKNEYSSADGTHGRPHKDEYPVTMRGEGIYFGTLIGRIGNNPPFKIGSKMRYTVPLGQRGKLVLLMNDRVNCYSDNSGSMKVYLKVTTAKNKSLHQRNCLDSMKKDYNRAKRGKEATKNVSALKGGDRFNKSHSVKYLGLQRNLWVEKKC